MTISSEKAVKRDYCVHCHGQLTDRCDIFNIAAATTKLLGKSELCEPVTKLLCFNLQMNLCQSFGYSAGGLLAFAVSHTLVRL